MVQTIEVETTEQWLAARRNYVTATDMARIMAGEREQVRREKRYGSSFQGNRYTAWGKTREPVILESFSREVQVPVEANGDRLWVDGRRAATPDATGKTRDGEGFLIEVKTTGRDWTVRREGAVDSAATLGNIPVKYMTQVQWQMLVTGYRSCMLVWETRLEVDGEFQPGEIHHIEIKADEAVQAELEDAFREFITYLDAPETVDTWIDSWHELYRDAKAAVDAAKAEFDAAKAQLENVLDYVRDRAADGDIELSGSGVQVSARWRTSRRFDAAAFRTAMPDKYGEFLVETKESRPRVTVTVLEGKEQTV